MTAEELLSILRQAGILKINTRHCYTQEKRRESVADHSWRLSLMAMLLSGEDEFRDVDMNKVIRMCLIHDLGESFTGDIPTFQKTSSDTQAEDKIFEDWVNSFPEIQRKEWCSLLHEMESCTSKEAKIWKALDKLEAIISHNESDIKTWLPLEYDLQFTYGSKETAFSPYLTKLHDAIDQWTAEKIKKEANGQSSKIQRF